MSSTPRPFPFQVRRQVFDGDFTRGLPGSRSVIRYGEVLPEALERSLFASQPEGYDGIKLWWGVPPVGLDTWSYMAIVRSGFGHPTVPTDGVIVSGMLGTSDDEVPGSFIDTGLQAGRWYYYTLMFRVGQRWYPVQTTEQMVPIDYKHGETMFNLLPPYYQSLDAEQWAGTNNSILRRWMDTIGYDLDMTRSLVEGLDKLYDPDSSPMSLFKAMGQQNFGFDPNEALGDIRYRGIVAASREISDLRGTEAGLRAYLEAATKYETYVSAGLNILLLGDDGHFRTGQGNWCPSAYAGNVAILAFLDETTALADPPDHIPTRGLVIETMDIEDDRYLAPLIPLDLTETVYPIRTVAKLTPAAGGHVAISAGSGQQDTTIAVDETTGLRTTHLSHLDPTFRGIPITAGTNYYLSFYLGRNEGNTETERVEYGFAWFERDLPHVGFSDAFRSLGIGSYPAVEPLDVFTAVDAPNSSDDWKRYVMVGTAPDDARFLVPYIWVHDSTGQPITTPRYLTGAMVTPEQGIGIEVVYRPDIFLVITEDVGDVDNVIGDTSGKVIGESRT